MIGEELQRNDAQDRRDVFGHVGDVEDVVGLVEDVLVALGGDGDDRALARLDLLEIVDVLVVDAVRGQRKTLGVCSSTSAMTPCLSSAVG